MRSYHWAHRAEIEYEAAQLTWLGTFTLSPMSHAIIDARVARRAHEAGSAWLTDWPTTDLFRARAREAGAEITKYLKRLRSEGRLFRYLLVAEEHKGARRPGTLDCETADEKEGAPRSGGGHLEVVSRAPSSHVTGLPHWHVLVHEKCAGDFIRPDETYLVKSGRNAGELRADDSSLVKTEWKLGFTQFKALTNVDEASYLCKYLSKDMLWRVRASQRYGKIQSTEGTEDKERQMSDSASSNMHPDRDLSKVPPYSSAHEVSS